MTLPYQDSGPSIEGRADDPLAPMTLEEKAGCMVGLMACAEPEQGGAVKS